MRALTRVQPSLVDFACVDCRLASWQQNRLLLSALGPFGRHKRGHLDRSQISPMCLFLEKEKFVCCKARIEREEPPRRPSLRCKTQPTQWPPHSLLAAVHFMTLSTQILDSPPLRLKTCSSPSSFSSNSLPPFRPRSLLFPISPRGQFRAVILAHRLQLFRTNSGGGGGGEERKSKERILLARPPPNPSGTKTSPSNRLGTRGGGEGGREASVCRGRVCIGQSLWHLQCLLLCLLYRAATLTAGGRGTD